MTAGGRTSGSAKPARASKAAAKPGRAERTRASLLRGARTVFERDGFLDARISDIAKVAGVSYGSFYTYFPAKEDAFRELVEELQSELLGPFDALAADVSDPRARIEEGQRAYLKGYQRNAALMATLEQVATFHDEMRELRRQLRASFVDRSARAIRHWQGTGLADATLDADISATALCSMVERFAYVWLVLGEPFDEDAAVENLTRLWCHALGVPVAAASRPPARRTAARKSASRGPRTPRRSSA